MFVIDDEVKPVGVPHEPIEKSTLEISKKILPTASIFIRHVLLETDGTVMDSDQSFAVLASNTVGNVCPPSVDNDILTLAQLTGASAVPFTLHVTV